jgi:hypothetical protein
MGSRRRGGGHRSGHRRPAEAALTHAARCLALAAVIGATTSATARAQPVDEPLAPRLGLRGEALPPGRDRFKSPQHFAIELRFGPYLPDVDGEFNGAFTPYRDYFGDSPGLLSQLEIDYEFFHRLGTAALGVGFGYFSVSAGAPVADGTGLASGDSSSLTVMPFSASAIYRFDYFLERNRFPLVPYGKLGLNYAYWRITDGNDQVATDSLGALGRGGTLGWHAAVGLQLVLDFFDWEAARGFDADMGVNHTSLVFQYTYADISGLGRAGQLHVGDANWSLGIMFQF